MQRLLYLDNCRGFSNCWIPLADVNFLVGENSTGKTSVLLLSRFIVSPKTFLETPSAHAAKLGLFREIVSAHSDNKDYFCLGAVNGTEVKDAGLALGGMLLTFVDENGSPRLKAVTSANGDRQVTFFLESDAIFQDIVDLPVSDVETMKDRVDKWKATHLAARTETATKIESPAGLTGSGLPIILAFIWLANSEGNTPEKMVFPPVIGEDDPIWISPIRSKPRRTYDQPETLFSSEGDHTPYLIRRMLKSSEDKKRLNEFLERVGKRSGLFEEIRVKSFGDDALGPFEIDAVIGGLPLNLSWVGYGVSQCLPILVELIHQKAATWFAIQQPEVHLHPRAQACLGDVFFEAALDGKRLLVETHSDFTIDRFRMNYRRERKHKPTSQILFFERKGKQNTVVPIDISAEGEISDAQPTSYRRFFVREENKLLGI